MKNKLFLSVIMFFMAATFANATGLATYRNGKNYKKPGFGDVTIIGRLTVKASQNLDFVCAARNLEDINKDEGDRYKIESNSLQSYLQADRGLVDSARTDYNEITKFYKEQKTIYVNGDYFIATYDRSEINEMFCLDRVPFEFFGDNRMHMNLPIGKACVLPKKAKAVYIGSWTIETSGNEFVVTKVSQADEFENAQAFLDNAFNKHYDLVRAEMVDIEEFKNTR